MSVIGSNILAGASGQGGGYNLTKSLRFRSSANAYLNRTPASAGNRKTWTWSGWVKRGTLGTNQSLFTCYFANNDTSYLTISFTSDNLNIGLWNTSILYTSAVYRDPSAWYHIVLAIDTTQATDTNRAKLYVNGVQVTAFGSTGYPAQNTDLAVNSAAAHYISTYDGTNYKFDGYLAEVNFIDGQALTPSSFGETSTTTGVWIPKKYTGTYGTNGFYLPFTDTTSTSTLGTDFSGNSNTWTVNNISLTSGSTYDSMNDVPTLTSATTANYAVMNPLQGTGITGSFYLDSANLNLNVTNNSGYRNLGATFSPEGFKGYFEVTMVTSPNGEFGFAYESIVPSNVQYASAGTFYIEDVSGDVRNGSTTIKSGCTPAFSSGDILQIAFDFTNGSRNVWFGRNGTWGSNSVGVGVPSTGTNPVLTVSNIAQASRFYFAVNTGGGTVTVAANFGQRPFAYTPPTGFVALNTFNLPTPTIGATASTTANKYFDSVIWTGDQTNKQIPLNFTADFVWAKRRDNSDNHVLYDIIRGVNNGLNSNTTNPEATNDYGLDFDNGNYLDINGTKYFGGGGGSGITFVAWNWKANGTGVTNTAGSITSTVSANTTAGFSIVTWTGSGSTATIGHGLGVTPSMIIWMHRTNAGAYNHGVYHSSLSSAAYALQLSTTLGQSSDNNWWNSTAPTSSVFTVGGYNISDTMVAYCFAPVAGYSAFGSYTGNDSADGTFIYTGFRPAFVLYKKANGIDGWLIYDAKRNTYNVADALLQPNTSGAEAVSAAGSIDILSNGFKQRNANNIGNSSSFTYIYMAFAEHPFKYANAR